jgi:predicted kinase
MRLVAFTGLAGVGKTTAAKILMADHGFVRVRFAEPLRAMLRALGLSDLELEGAWKEKPCDLLNGKTPRYAMQTLGTEWGRNMIDPNFWVDAWFRRAHHVMAHGDNVVVDDCRFPNEVAAVHRLSGKIIKIRREDVSAMSHVSELQTLACDESIINDGDEDALAASLTEVLARFEESPAQGA